MSHRGYEPGKSIRVQIVWWFVHSVLFANPLVTSYGFKRIILRAFGADIGTGVLIKPRARVKYPWHLTIGRDAWIGEGAWIDNFVEVVIGEDACVSQGAYLCTGNHDWASDHMDLVVKPIRIGDGAWVGAHARVGPGVTIADRSVVTLGAVVVGDTEPLGIYVGAPAVRAGTRTFSSD